MQPSWHIALWTDEDNEDLIRSQFPWFLESYLALPKPIERVDAVRFAYLAVYGGVYADLDFASIRSLDGSQFAFGSQTDRQACSDRLQSQAVKDPPASNVPDLPGSGLDPVPAQSSQGQFKTNVRSHLLDPAYDVVLGLMDSNPWQRPHNIPNAFMASKPGVGLWEDCLRDVDAKVRAGKITKRTAVETIAGPVALKACVEKHGHKYRILVHSPEVIFPQDWSRSQCETCSAVPATSSSTPLQGADMAEELMTIAPLSYATTFWTHTWGSQ